MLTEEQILDLIDGNLSPETEAKYLQIISENPENQILYQELLAIHEQILDLGFEHPSMRFTENVIEKWIKVQAVPLIRVPKSLPYWFLGITTSLLSVIVFYFNRQPQNKLFPEAEKLFSIVNQADFVRIFLIINAFLLILILDKAVLKPYFKKTIQPTSPRRGS